MADGLPRARALPITVIDSHRTVIEEAREHHAHANAGVGVPARPAPCVLFVAGTAISEADIACEMQFHRAMTPEKSRADAARALVVRELLRCEIERLGLDTPVVGNEPIEEARIRVLLEREVENRVPSEDDCRRYYEQNPERFRAPDRIRVRHILLGAPADDVAGRLEARTRAEQLIGELKTQPHLFVDFALRFSACPSKDAGGELGWLERGQTVPEFDRQVFRLRQGLAGFPVESRWGYHVVCIDALSTGDTLAFDGVHQRISDYLELQVRQREIQNYLHGLRARYEVRGLEEIEAAAT